MAVEWKEEYRVGYELIDSQHQELFRRFNELILACRQSRGRSRVGNLIDYLGEYVIHHFSEEERLMTVHGYPEAGQHRAQHLEFIGKLEGLKKILGEEGSSIHLIARTNDTVLQWLSQHIRKVDVAFGAFLQREQ